MSFKNDDINKKYSKIKQKHRNNKNEPDKKEWKSKEEAEIRHPIIQGILDSNDEKIKRALKNGYRLYYDPDTGIVTLLGPVKSNTVINVKHVRRSNAKICEMLSMAIKDLIDAGCIYEGKSLMDVLKSQEISKN